MRNKNISERINLVLNSKKVSIRAFARNINCANTTIGAILREKAEPNYSTLFSILEYYPDISPEWLITGEGEMYKKIDNDSASTQDEFYANHVKEITKIILRKLEEYAESTPIENILSSVCAEDCSQKAKRIQKKITPIKSK